jgi:LysR family glycine cleavage system transcriptional activator
MKPLVRLPLNALRVFDAVARCGSMSRAAEALNVQPSAVSMQMKNLAEFVGRPLVVKVGKRVELTRDGELLLQGALPGLRQVEAALTGLRRSARERPFTLSTTPAILHLWLMPRLAQFEALHPGMRLRVVSSRELVDPNRGEIDAALRLGPGRWPGARAVKLMDEGLVPACTPSLAKRVGVLGAGEMPRRATLLASTLDPWTLWSPEGGKGKTPSVQADDAISVVRAAEQGQGVALVRTTLIEAALREKRLVMVGEPIPYRYSYYWVTGQDAMRDPRADTFLRWLRSQLPSPARRPISG